MISEKEIRGRLFSLKRGRSQYVEFVEEQYGEGYIDRHKSEAFMRYQIKIEMLEWVLNDTQSNIDS